MTRWLLVLTLLWPLAACSGPKSSDSVAVPVSAINYTGEELNSFLFIHPQTGTPAGGPGLRPFEAGGTMCCYRLPQKWRPGMKVKLRWDWWQGDDKPRLYQERIFDIPPYAGGEAGMLWAIFYGGDDVEVVVSNVDPGHPAWPGRIRHWPKPSLEYKRKLWQEEWEHLQRQKTSFEKYLKNLSERDWEEEWTYQKERHRDQLQQFRGPDDPAFRAWRKSAYEEAIADIDREIRLLESRKP